MSFKYFVTSRWPCWYELLISVNIIAGTYHVGVKWNGEHVRQSPFAVTILQQNKEAKLVAVEGLRDRGTEVRDIDYSCYNII